MTVTFDELATGHELDELEFGLTQLPPAPPTAVAVIESIATGAPSRVVEQTAAADQVAMLFDDPTQRERIRRVYQKTRIDARRMAVDPTDADFDEFRRQPATLRDRMNLFYEHAAPLAVEVAGRALSGHDTADIGLLVFVTSTGFIAPGVDVAVVKQLGLSPSVSRVVVNFMGCAAAMNGLRTAADFVRAHPGMKAMVVCIELCSVNAVFAEDVNDIIISSLFGDGCAAVVLGASPVQQPLGPGKVVIRDSFSRLLDDAEDGIVLGVNHDGITCELSENLPAYIYSGVDPVITEVLADNGLAQVRRRPVGGSPRRAQDHRGIGAISGNSRRGNHTQLGCPGPVRQHAECFAAVRSGTDGGASRFDHLDRRGVLVCARGRGRGTGVRHRPRLDRHEPSSSERQQPCNSSSYCSRSRGHRSRRSSPPA